MKVKKEEPALNVSSHLLVPKHELVSPKEAEKLLKTFNARREQLPYMLGRDPVALEIGAKPGDLVRITRRSETAGESTYYRYIVEG